MTRTNSGFGFIGIIIIVAVVAAIGGGTYYSAKKASRVAIDTNVQATSSLKVETDKMRGAGTTTIASNSVTTSVGVKVGSFNNGSIRSLLNAGKDLECNISYSTTTAKGVLKTDGTVFISGDMMRGDFTMTGAAATASDAHIIREGDNIIAWSGKQGAKLSLSAVTSGASASSNSQVSLDQNVLYKCSDWNRDASKFTVPAEVKIYDVSSLMINTAGKVQTTR